MIENLLQSHETLQQNLDDACRQLDLFRSIKREDRASSPLPPGAVPLPDAAAARGDAGGAPDDVETRVEPSAPQRIAAGRVLSTKRGMLLDPEWPACSLTVQQISPPKLSAEKRPNYQTRRWRAH